MRCRVCHEAELVPLWPATAERGEWSRCLACGSDTSAADYAALRGEYDAAYLAHLAELLGGVGGCAAALSPNADWFGPPAGDGTFLDVGCLEGGGLRAMADRGWSVHGFDVIPEARTGDHVTVADRFRAGLFPRRYRAVLCREVIEHVPDWRGLLGELFAATQPEGLCQVQTPRPWSEPDPRPYQRWHLQVFAPFVLRQQLGAAGFDVIGQLLWPAGQAYLCRRPR